MPTTSGCAHWEQHTCRYANGVPLVEGEGALKVNWCEMTITGKRRKKPHHNAWVTDWTIADENVAGIVATGRSRWKIENENNNTLKTKGCHCCPSWEAMMDFLMRGLEIGPYAAEAHKDEWRLPQMGADDSPRRANPTNARPLISDRGNVQRFHVPTFNVPSWPLIAPP
jgi:hypothetical protein